MYKLVAIDLDGTMLNSYGVVTENTKQAIKETIKQGTDVIIASGRSSISYLKNLAEEIGSKNYFISGNGALIYDIKNDEILYKKYMSKQKVLDIIKNCEGNSIFYNVYTEKSIIAKSLNYNILYYHKENLKREEEKQTRINIVENPYEYIKNMEEEDFLKVTICDEDKAIFNSIIRKIKEIEGIEVLDVAHMSKKIIKQGTQEVELEYYYTEISKEGADKWNAIQYLIDTLGIKTEEVVAIGDNVNDINMIKNAGLGIAMKGSTPAVISQADYVTDDNDSDGVAKALTCKILH
jgi:hypothetical protein